jgi:hypothetical protein
MSEKTRQDFNEDKFTYEDSVEDQHTCDSCTKKNIFYRNVNFNNMAPVRYLICELYAEKSTK